MRMVWTNELDAKLRQRYPNEKAKNIARDFGTTISAVYVRAGKLKLKKAPGFVSKTVKEHMLSKSKWTAEKDAELSRRYPDEQSETIAKDMGFTLISIYHRAQKLGLQKSKEFMASEASGRIQHPCHASRRHRFKPGHQPWNKGKKGVITGGEKTRFKKGDKPHNWVPIGSERVSHDGYRQRKMTDTGYPPKDWVFLHRKLWIEHHGAIPRGHAVCFKDGDKTNITIENLELLTYKERMKRNTVHNLPEELVEVVRLRGQIVRQINKQEGKHVRK